MSDAIQYINTDDEQFDNAPRALRDAYEQLKKSHKELSQETTTLRGQVTQQALSGVLTEFKNPERVKSALLADKVDPLNAEAVNKWLADNGDDYAKGPATPAPNQAPVADEAEQAAHQQIQQSTAQFNQAAEMTKRAAFEAEITPDMDGAAVRALAIKHGI
jgi:uncharacterized protein (DUF2336 family)